MGTICLAQSPLLPSLQSTEPIGELNRYQFFADENAIFLRQDSKGATRIRGSRAGASARGGTHSRAISTQWWGSVVFGKAYGPYLQNGTTGTVDADLTDRQFGGEITMNRGLGFGASVRSGELRVSATSSAFLPLVFLPNAPATLTGKVPLDSRSAWLVYRSGLWEAKVGREWRDQAILGAIPYNDRPGDTSLPACALPDLTEYSLNYDGRGAQWKASLSTGRRSGYVDLDNGIGLALSEGNLIEFRLAAIRGRQELRLSYSGYAGDASGVITSGDSLHIGLPVASVVTYNDTLRGRETQLEFVEPVRTRHGDARLTLGHAWVFGEATGDYDAQVLFLHLRGSANARANNRALVFGFRWEGAGTVRPYLALQQVVPYTIGHTGGSGGAGAGLGKTYGGGSIEVGWTGPLGK